MLSALQGALGKKSILEIIAGMLKISIYEHDFRENEENIIKYEPLNDISTLEDFNE
jgi:hypothetical protein